MLGRIEFDKLLQPTQIRNVRLRNRIICPAHCRYLAAEGGYVSEETLATYEALAKGGVGLAVIEWCAVDFPSGFRLRHHAIADDRFIPGLRKLATIFHRHCCPVFLQLAHAGPAQVLNEFNLQPVSSSILTDYERPIPSYDLARELTIVEIEDLVDKFASAAERAEEAGFDGVEIHGAHGYLINSFLSCAWNKRKDIYGSQSLESRARFAIEIIQETKKRVGQNFPVGIRINGQEWGHELGIISENSREFARMFEEAGSDYISVSGYGYGPYQWVVFPKQITYPASREEFSTVVTKISKPGIFVHAAETIKRVVSVPVVVAGGINPKLGDWILKRDKADLIGMARRLMADPELPNKLAAGRLDDIVPCMGCNECLDSFVKTEPIRCRINAALGKELKLK